LPGNDSRDIHTDGSDGRDRCTEYAVEMNSGTVTYVSGFINIGSGILKLTWVGGLIHRETVIS
jgi:hypothetical protein